MKPKIFIISQPIPDSSDVVGLALAQDGTGLAQHLSSNAIYLRCDMGLYSRRKHQLYEEHYPDGYELVDYIDADDTELDSDPLFVRAYLINHQAGVNDGVEPKSP